MSVWQPKLWALRDGINMYIELNLLAVVTELDLKLTVDILMKDDGSSNDNDVIVADCKDGLKKIMRIRVQRCFREVNRCTNILARRDALLSQNFVVFSLPPASVSLLISLDFVGTMYERVCSNVFAVSLLNFFHFYSSLIIILLK